MQGICQAYARYMPDIYRAYNICLRLTYTGHITYARHMPGMCQIQCQVYIAYAHWSKVFFLHKVLIILDCI
jgi:hypothetical protein